MVDTAYQNLHPFLADTIGALASEHTQILLASPTSRFRTELARGREGSAKTALMTRFLYCFALF
jgi:hypothetical protein